MSGTFQWTKYTTEEERELHCFPLSIWFSLVVHSAWETGCDHLFCMPMHVLCIFQFHIIITVVCYTCWASYFLSPFTIHPPYPSPTSLIELRHTKMQSFNYKWIQFATNNYAKPGNQHKEKMINSFKAHRMLHIKTKESSKTEDLQVRTNKP